MDKRTDLDTHQVRQEPVWHDVWPHPSPLPPHTPERDPGPEGPCGCHITQLRQEDRKNILLNSRRCNSAGLYFGKIISYKERVGSSPTPWHYSLFMPLVPQPEWEWERSGGEPNTLHITYCFESTSVWKKGLLNLFDFRVCQDKKKYSMFSYQKIYIEMLRTIYKKS